ncbi:MAG: hypothetical protein IMY67_02295 [Bacteroidetes bacterium]|nr:hypothetical protein [Bacteroidota bacterium]
MEETIRKLLVISNINKMENQSILMNKTDFENFKKEVESKVKNLKPSNISTYEGVPIVVNSLIKRGKAYVCDNKPQQK